MLRFNVAWVGDSDALISYPKKFRFYPLLDNISCISWLAEWYFRSFRQYFSHSTATVHIIHVFPWFHQYYAGALKCLAQGHSHEKTQRIKYGSNPGPLDYESKTLPLSHAGPLVHLDSLSETLYGKLDLAFRVRVYKT